MNHYDVGTIHGRDQHLNPFRNGDEISTYGSGVAGINEGILAQHTRKWYRIVQGSCRTTAMRK
jgi:hypothetical protein